MITSFCFYDALNESPRRRATRYLKPISFIYASRGEELTRQKAPGRPKTAFGGLNPSWIFLRRIQGSRRETEKP
jgi:hypothetical protein